jgi:hypothetical protein
MNIGSTISLYDEMEKSINQEQKLEMSNLGNLAKLGSVVGAIGGFIKGNKASVAEGGEGKGLFGKEDGFMSKFGTGQGWFSEAFENIGPVDTTAYKQPKTKALWDYDSGFEMDPSVFHKEFYETLK